MQETILKRGVSAEAAKVRRLNVERKNAQAFNVTQLVDIILRSMNSRSKLIVEFGAGSGSVGIPLAVQYPDNQVPPSTIKSFYSRTDRTSREASSVCTNSA